MQTMTKEERSVIIEQALAAGKSGNDKEMSRLMKLLPLPAHLAVAAKEIWGKEFLLEGGYDLSAAEAEHGKNWLE